MPSLPISTALVAAVTLLTAGLTPASGAAAGTASSAGADYGDSMSVTFGANDKSAMPAHLVLPVPGDGRRVTRVQFWWLQNAPTYQGGSTGTFVVETPQCTADSTCEVTTTVPTARMKNSVISSVTVSAYDGDAPDGATKIGSTTRTVNIQNPKPTVAFTAPAGHATFWDEPVTLAAEATPSSSGAPIRRVRFYVNPNGNEDDPFLEDRTAPYSVTVPASSIAESTKGGTVYAVAEDVEGNLSQYTSETTKPFMRYVRVGPPPLVSWRFPAVDGRSAGGMSTEAFLHWDTAIPASAPPSDTNPESPYLEQFQVYRDGELILDRRYDQRASWDGFGGGAKVRAFESSLHWTPTTGMTPGEHTVTVRVRTSYGSVATATRRFVITDGVRLGRVMSGPRVVRDGHVVTAGTWVPLRFPVVGKVPGSNVQEYDVLLDGESIIGGSPGCTLALWWNCPGSVTARASWSVPERPGTYTLTFAGREVHDAAPTTTTRTFTVQPAGAIRSRVSASTVRVGDPVVAQGQIVRTDTGRGVRGVPATLQWRKAGTTRWVAVATRTSGVGGRVRATPVRRATGFYRWVSPGVLGTLGASRSRASKVTVLR